MIKLNIDLEDPEVIRQIIGSFVAGEPEQAPADEPVELRRFMCARVYQIKPDEYLRFLKGGMGLIPDGFKPSFPEDFEWVAFVDGGNAPADTGEFLEDVYRLTNSVDGCWTEDDRDDRLISILDDCRSTSVGDVIELIETGGKKVLMNVANAGFTPRAS